MYFLFILFFWGGGINGGRGLNEIPHASLELTL